YLLLYQFLVLQYSIISNLFKSPFIAPSTNTHYVCQFIYGYFFVLIYFNVLLDLFHLCILVVFLSFKYNEGILAIPINIYTKIFGCDNGQFSTGVFFNQI